MTASAANELLTTGQMQCADAWAVAHGVPGIVLMEHAGAAVARALMDRWPTCPVLVLCGPGNNGGDGYVVARLLRAAGWPVRVAALAPLAQLKGDALHHAQLWQQQVSQAAVGALGAALVEPERLGQGGGLLAPDTGLVVDALFGAGLSKPLDATLTALLQQAADRGIPIVAVDVPSGVLGDTGECWGAVRADLTVTFFRKKLAHVLMPARAHCGSPSMWRWPMLDPLGHKYERGHVLVFGGARMVGAARLASRAAARVGAGLVTLLVPQAVWPLHAGHLMSAMAWPLADGGDATLLQDWARQLGAMHWQALLLGPGAALGLPGDARQTLRQMVLSALALSHGRAMVLDADALTAFEHEPQTLFDAIARTGGPVVLTPHAGEFARLFGEPDEQEAANKLTRTRAAARRSGAVVLFKGPDTVIAAPDGRVVVNTLAPPSLATAGSGDVLAGFITGLLAQGLPAMEAACAGAWVHGACAQAFGPGLLAEDLPEMMPRVLADQG
jgi:hydroxyethylthiazole kinase-like uncharacterized protein yjeF